MIKTNKILLIIIILLTFLLLYGCSPNNEEINNEDEVNNENDIKNQEQKQETEKEVMYASDFELEDLEGNLVKLSDFKGKKIFLNFWATWCPPCQAEIPDFIKLYDEYKEDDFVIIAVNVGEQIDKVKDFVEEYQMNFVVLLDEYSEIATMYGIRAFPTTLAINEDGEIIVGQEGMLSYELMQVMYYYFD